MGRVLRARGPGARFDRAVRPGARRGPGHDGAGGHRGARRPAGRGAGRRGARGPRRDGRCCSTWCSGCSPWRAPSRWCSGWPPSTDRPPPGRGQTGEPRLPGPGGRRPPRSARAGRAGAGRGRRRGRPDVAASRQRRASTRGEPRQGAPRPGRRGAARGEPRRDAQLPAVLRRGVHAPGAVPGAPRRTYQRPGTRPGDGRDRRRSVGGAGPRAPGQLGPGGRVGHPAHRAGDHRGRAAGARRGLRRVPRPPDRASA